MISFKQLVTIYTCHRLNARSRLSSAWTKANKSYCSSIKTWNKPTISRCKSIRSGLWKISIKDSKLLTVSLTTFLLQEWRTRQFRSRTATSYATSTISTVANQARKSMECSSKSVNILSFLLISIRLARIALSNLIRLKRIRLWKLLLSIQPFATLNSHWNCRQQNTCIIRCQCRVGCAYSRSTKWKTEWMQMEKHASKMIKNFWFSNNRHVIILVNFVTIAKFQSRKATTRSTLTWQK